MPKKRHQAQTFKPSSSAAHANSSSSSFASSSGSSGKQNRSVNELLANLRRSTLGSSSGSSFSSLPVNSPSVPPDLRQILNIPETPAPAPRRYARFRTDGTGRRLPAGPPPPRSWVNNGGSPRPPAAGVNRPNSGFSELSPPGSHLPGTYVPAKGSLVDIVLKSMALHWEIHRVADRDYFCHLPSHLKPSLIRLVGMVHGCITMSDLKAILSPPDESQDGNEGVEHSDFSNLGVTYLDFSNCIGESLRLRDVFDLIQPTRDNDADDSVEESWDQVNLSSDPSRCLLPSLTHLSLALHPHSISKLDLSWRQLVHHADKLSSITHLSLAYWPTPCLTTGTKTVTVASPAGRIPYGGTTLYSHTLDQDWSEALLVLRRFSKSLYQLEFLDLTGCAPWFPALMAESGSDRVDWVGTWGKIGTLRLSSGRRPSANALPSERIAYEEARKTAMDVEKHIRARRAGKGRIITVERDE